MSTQGRTSDPVSPDGSMYVGGIGRTLAPPAGSARTGAGQSCSGSPGSRSAGRSARSGRVTESRSRSGRDAGWAWGLVSAPGVGVTSAGLRRSCTGRDLLGRPPCRPDKGPCTPPLDMRCDAIRRCEGEQRGRLLAEVDLRDLGRLGRRRDRADRRRPCPGCGCAGSAASRSSIQRSPPAQVRWWAGRPATVFGADVSPARRRRPVAGLARIPAHLAARPSAGLQAE